MDTQKLFILLNFLISAVLFVLSYYGDKKKQVVRMLYSIWFLIISVSFKIL